ncbi:MAG: RNA methyltransferase [bacterium]|nr:RNA methyltransferase [bacterium]
MEDLAPAIVLIEPQLGDNIGAAARAMLNCGLQDLRLVRPRDGWPNPNARAMASGADEVLDRARQFDTLADAVADLRWVFATTGRRRDMVKHEVTPAEAAAEIHRKSALGERCGVLFGRERIGLTNDEVVLADAILTVPLNPAFRSLNLGQAVLLVAYEWFRFADETPPRQRIEAGLPRATHGELQIFIDHLEEALTSADYFKVDEMKPVIVRAIRNLFTRAELTDREVRTLHGIVTALVGRRRDQL